MANKHKIIGNAERRVDAGGKVTGRARFAEDYAAPHQLWGKVLRSSYPHARILRIDTRKAEQLPGVEAVLVAKDIPGSKTFGAPAKDHCILADEKCRYLGDGLAIVAARTKRIAEEAIRNIEVDYEPLPVVSDPELGMAPDAPKIHGDDNIVVHHTVRQGDVDKGFRQAEVIIKRVFKTQFVEHSYIEPEAILAEPAEQGGVTLTGSVQNLFTTRRVVAAALGLDLNRVHIVQATLGGSFGGKDEVMSVMCCRAALLCLKTGKPVKMVNTREESMLESYKRHPYSMHYTWGAKGDGTVTAMEMRCVADAGAYAATSPFVTWRSVVQATGPYRCRNVRTDVYAVYTNNTYTGAMRGFGSPQVNFAIESMMDELAEATGLSPLEIRMRNAFDRGDVTATGQTLDHVVSIKEVLTKAAGAAGFEEKWKRYREPGGEVRRHGIGLACSYRGVSLGAEGVDAAQTMVSVQTDGSVIVASGVTDMGQGAQTQMSQIVAEVLGISMDRIQFLNTNTSRSADSGPTVASRGTIMGGTAAKRAAEAVRTTLLTVGGEMTATSPGELDLMDNYLVRIQDGKRLASFSELAAGCFAKGKPMHGVGWHQSPATSWHEEKGQGEAYFTFVYGANVAEVEVDRETGKVDVVHVVSVHDVGKAINRATVQGQMYGGVAMGLGYGLLEEFEIEEGVPKQLNFDEYLIPTSMDVPGITTIIVENEDAAGPFGAKSVAEPANELAAPAIVNAIFNATGCRVYELPATLEKVLLGHKLARPGKRGSLRKGLEDEFPEGSCKIDSPK